LIASCSSPKNEDNKDNNKDTTSEHTDTNPTPEKGHPKKKKESIKEADSTYYYDPSVSILSGTLKEEEFYGPPGYGESPDKDSKEKQFILYLDNPINVKRDKKSDSDFDAKYKQDKITLIIKSSTSPFKHRIGKSIKVKGTLFPAETGHHHTDVLLGDAEIVK
jgi:hypothetical protein